MTNPETDELAVARATNQRLNRRAQELEAELAAYRRAVAQWEISKRGTYIPHASLRAIGLASGRDILGSVRHLRHFERVEQAEAAIERVRRLLDALGAETDLTSPDHEITRGAAARKIAAALDGWSPPAAVSVPPPAPRADDQAALRDRIRRAVCEAEGFGWDTDMLEPDEYGEVADAVLAVLPEPADRAAVRAAAFDEAAEKLAGLDPVKAALAGQHAWNDAAGIVQHMARQERRMADEEQQPERPRCPHCGLPHDLTPSMDLACASIRASIADHHAAVSGPCVAGEQQPAVAGHEWCKCRSCWGWFVEEHPGEDLDELGRDLGWWSGLPEHRDPPAEVAGGQQNETPEAEIEHLRDRLASCRERVGIAADKAIAAEDAIARARQARRRLTSALIAVEPLLTEPYPDDPRWTPWTRFVGPALKELSDALKTGPAAHAPSRLAPEEQNETSDDVDPVYDPRAWETYRRDAGCGCTAPAPVDCKIPHGTGTWLCTCHRLSGPPWKDGEPRGTFLTAEEEAVRKHFQEPNRCTSTDGIFRCSRPTGHLGDHRTGRTFWARRPTDVEAPE